MTVSIPSLGMQPGMPLAQVCSPGPGAWQQKPMLGFSPSQGQDLQPGTPRRHHEWVLARQIPWEVGSSPSRPEERPCVGAADPAAASILWQVPRERSTPPHCCD